MLVILSYPRFLALSCFLSLFSLLGCHNPTPPSLRPAVYQLDTPDPTFALLGSDNLIRVFDKDQNLLHFGPDSVAKALLFPDRIHLLWQDPKRSLHVVSLLDPTAKIDLEGTLLIPLASAYLDASQLWVLRNDGTLFFYSSNDGHILNQEPLVPYAEEQTYVEAALALPGSTQVLVFRNSELQLWDISSRRMLQGLGSFQAQVTALGVAPDGTDLAVGFSDLSLHMFSLDPDFRQWKAGFIEKGLPGEVVQISLNNQKPTASEGQNTIPRVMALLGTGEARVYLGQGGLCQRVVSDAGLAGASITPEGNEIWGIEGTGEGVRFTLEANCFSDPTIFSGHATSLISAIFSPDGYRVLTTSFDGTVKLWDAKTGTLVQNFDTRQRTFSSITPAIFSPFRPYIVMTLVDQTLFQWNVDGSAIGPIVLKDTRTYPSNLSSSALYLDADSNTKQEFHVVTAGFDKTIQVWDLKTGNPMGSPWMGHTAPILSMEISPEYNTLLTTSVDHTAKVWDTSSGTVTLTLNHPYIVNSATFSTGHRMILTTSNGEARLWDASSGAVLLTTPKTYDSMGSPTFNLAALSKDESQLVTIDLFVGTIRLFDIASGSLLLGGSIPQPGSVAISSDGTKILTISDGNNTANLWNLDHKAKLTSTFSLPRP